MSHGRTKIPPPPATATDPLLGALVLAIVISPPIRIEYDYEYDHDYEQE
ncbi:MAG: hypothetical protein GTO46_11705 [Gemmatimonadetes bacterium]|nr:hypothetical protein [Gemmatimonadota bacterium]NIO32254.1 hypothetical protein [Gemmatimonadota bacterium]